MKALACMTLAVAALTGCAAPPMGPMVQVMPGPGKPFSDFQADDANCRGFASMQTAGQAQAANQQAVGGAVLTTALGAGLGAAIGGGRGAAIGAASGAGLGAAYGAAGTANAQGGIQMQYDAAYSQCMYSLGNQVPGFAPLAAAYEPAAYPAGPGLVRAVQWELNRLGYRVGPPDGMAGGRTLTAIRDFQAAHGLPADGAATPSLLDQLRQTPSAY
ncbi:MAG: peptidoglycan-binding protein [Acetobacteraceae bacterium]|nr:peptidoglycan-binding protein [Acetobacteraceae bacterium]